MPSPVFVVVESKPIESAKVLKCTGLKLSMHLTVKESPFFSRLEVGIGSLRFGFSCLRKKKQLPNQTNTFLHG